MPQEANEDKNLDVEMANNEVPDEKKDANMVEENSSSEQQKLSQSGLNKNSMASMHRLMTFQSPSQEKATEVSSSSIYQPYFKPEYNLFFAT